MTVQAGSSGPDLSGARVAVEALMDDRCVVTGPTDPDSWVLDANLRLVPPPDAQPLYEGPCKVNSEGGSAARAVGGVQQSVAGQSIDFPLDQLVGGQLQVTPSFPAGSSVGIAASRRDPQLVGQVFVVKETVLKTMAVKRTVLAERQTRVEP